MFADPIANITYNGVAQTLPRVSTTGTKSIYRAADGSLVLTISHTTLGNGLVRSLYRLDRFVDVNADLSLERDTHYYVRERPATGFTETDAVNAATCLFGSLTASTNAGIKKLNGQES